MKVSEDKKITRIKKWLGAGSINIFGLPFSGKDTHGTELSKLLNGVMIGGGDIIRNSKDSKLKKHISTGALAPKDEYLAMVLPFLSQDQFSKKPIVLSSVGRWVGEEESVLQSAIEAGHPTKAVILLNIDKEEVWKRWNDNERQRHDDAAEHILENRFSEFEEKTLPVIDNYRKLGLLLEIDGNQSKESVRSNIKNALYNLASQ